MSNRLHQKILDYTINSSKISKGLVLELRNEIYKCLPPIATNPSSIKT